ncbi:MAG: SufD family Fe-S cluster assembly protein [Rikenellaceae bacterium]
MVELQKCLEASEVTLLKNPESQSLRATQLVVLRSEASGDLTIEVAAGERLELVELLTEGGVGATKIVLAESSSVNATVIHTSESELSCSVELDGRGAEAEVNILQLASGESRVVSSLRLSHNVSDCVSRSLSKCVAAGNSKGIFNGMVYVAQDAQRTVAEQSSRNILISPTAYIKAEPQLEIYADDVKCTHGATVGQMNEEAIYYMMQRGLSEEQARRLQLDGFVAEVSQSCTIEPLRDALTEMVRCQLAKL